MSTTTPVLVVHGGCGDVPAEEEGPRNAACARAAAAGHAILSTGGSALEAAAEAVRALEDEPALNAGTGSYLQADGMARLDASIMASDGRAGAVAQVAGLRNPIRLARYLLEQDAHVMLAGEGAMRLGLSLGHPPAVVATPAKIDYWRDHLDEACRALDYARMAAAWKAENPRLGTVGCVALDREGRLAAATSTGGTGQSYPGRVGDSPIIGAGTYCTRLAAVSMTGVGERILVLLSAKRLCDLVAGGAALDVAAGAVLAEIEAQSSAAGLVALDRHGNVVAPRTTRFMAWARLPE
jgi:beta-aspartyl-peptidase (threonine type)